MATGTDNPAVAQVIQLIAAGVLQILQQRFPNGIPDPGATHTVLREDDDGNRRLVNTNLIQQLAELNDNLKDVVATNCEMLEEARKPRRRRRGGDDD